MLRWPILPLRSAAPDMRLAGLALWGKQQSIESLLIPHVWIMKRCWYRGGRRGVSVELSPLDLAEIVGAEIVDLAAQA